MGRRDSDNFSRRLRGHRPTAWNLRADSTVVIPIADRPAITYWFMCQRWAVDMRHVSAITPDSTPSDGDRATGG